MSDNKVPYKSWGDEDPVEPNGFSWWNAAAAVSAFVLYGWVAFMAITAVRLGFHEPMAHAAHPDARASAHRVDDPPDARHARWTKWRDAGAENHEGHDAVRTDGSQPH